MTEHDATSPALRRKLEEQFDGLGLVRPFRRACYDPGERLEYDATGVVPAREGRITVEVERFVGGGFAGQVYRVRLLDVEGQIEGLKAGKHYAIKILKPPSGLARVFRNFLYFLAYQSHFGPQVNPDAVRVGVLWQKLIRRAAAARFDDPAAVCDTFATFYDEGASAFGEINEWVDGRIWRFEVDDRLFTRWRFRGEPPEDHNCPEYVSKKKFMDDLVALLHEMGAGELARQYHWWTLKSQPNALKRTSADASPRAGLTAIDFRAGLALLPFLPMSPADFWLIGRGLLWGANRSVRPDRPQAVSAVHRRPRRGAERPGAGRRRAGRKGAGLPGVDARRDRASRAPARKPGPAPIDQAGRHYELETPRADRCRARGKAR